MSTPKNTHFWASLRRWSFPALTITTAFISWYREMKVRKFRFVDMDMPAFRNGANHGKETYA